MTIEEALEVVRNPEVYGVYYIDPTIEDAIDALVKEVVKGENNGKPD